MHGSNGNDSFKSQEGNDKLYCGNGYGELVEGQGNDYWMETSSMAGVTML